MSSLISSLEWFDSYFRGGSSDILKNHMKYYDQNLERLKKDFHKTTISENKEIKARIIFILESLNFSEEEWEQELQEGKLTIYEFLLKLAQNGYSQTDYIIDLIDKKTKLRKLTLFLGGGSLIAALITTLVATSTLQVVWELIKVFFSWLYAVPLLGLIGTFGMGVYHFYSNCHNQKITVFNRFRDNFFLFLSTSAKVTASVFLIGTGAVMSPVIAGIFVIGAAVEVIKEIFCLTQEYIQYKFFSPYLNQNDDPLSVHRAYARRVFGYEKRMEALRINLLAALIIVTIMALWCFLPGGGFAVSLAALAAIGLVYTAKYFLLKHSESTLREHLQHELNALEKDYPQSNNVITNLPRFSQEEPLNSELFDAPALAQPTKPSKELRFFRRSNQETTPSNPAHKPSHTSEEMLRDARS